MLKNKKERGQYYTTFNPFKGDAFKLWYSMIPKNEKILEPFAGAGNLFEFINADWVGYDIEPTKNGIIKRDVLKNFPKGYRIGVTNPPYLAKNSAKRMKMKYPYKNDDLYLECIEEMLKNLEYVAAIIPSTFWHTNKFRKRLLAWDKQDRELFSDTGAPAGVAYFGPDEYQSKIYVNGKQLQPLEFDSKKYNKTSLQMNVAHGNYIINGIDCHNHDNIFVHDDIKNFNREKYLKNTSRNYCLFYSNKELDIDKTNKKINKWRKDTKDFYLTSFKSVGKAGKYRKRISFTQLQHLVVLKNPEDKKSKFDQLFR